MNCCKRSLGLGKLSFIFSFSSSCFANHDIYSFQNVIEDSTILHKAFIWECILIFYLVSCRHVCYFLYFKCNFVSQSLHSNVYVVTNVFFQHFFYCCITHFKLFFVFLLIECVSFFSNFANQPPSFLPAHIITVRSPTMTFLSTAIS